MTIKAKVTREGLLIPRDVSERAFGTTLDVEIREERGRLVVAVAGAAEVEPTTGSQGAEDPIVRLGKSPVRTGTRDGSTDHDRYLYTKE